MAMQKVQIISFALSLLGKKPIISLDNQSDIVGAAEQAFDFLLPSVISKHQWRFAVKILQLSKLVETPPVTDWKYIFGLPSDYKKLIRLYPQNYLYEVYNNSVLYTNIDGPLYIEYQIEPTVSQLPDYFNHYFAYCIAEALALSNAHSVSFSNKLFQDKETYLAQALAADAQNRPNQGIQSMPMITNRALGYPGTYG